jgi:nucleotide-binding universal stress UspA family protein
MKIAVGIDFSRESELAARQAVEIARHVEGEVVLVHVATTVELPRVGSDAEPWLRPSMDTLRARLAEEQMRDRDRLSELRERLSGQGPLISQVLAEGFPEEALCAVADELPAELTVVGTHGRTGLRWFFLGSVAQQLVRLSRNDVIVARREVTGRGGFRRILVATDFSVAAGRALDRALALAAPDAEIHVLHFYHLRPLVGWEGNYTPAPEPDHNLVRELQAEGEKLLQPRRSRKGPRLVFHVEDGTPIPGVVHWLEQHDFELAALGSHGRRGFRRAVLGSVAEAVVRRAPCPVLVAHGGPGPRAG